MQHTVREALALTVCFIALAGTLTWLAMAAWGITAMGNCRPRSAAPGPPSSPAKRAAKHLLVSLQSLLQENHTVLQSQQDQILALQAVLPQVPAQDKPAAFA